MQKYSDEFKQSVNDSSLLPEQKKAIVEKIELWNKAADGDAEALIKLWEVFNLGEAPPNG